jgi:hypothetical protein
LMLSLWMSMIEGDFSVNALLFSKFLPIQVLGRLYLLVIREESPSKEIILLFLSPDGKSLS